MTTVYCAAQGAPFNSYCLLDKHNPYWQFISPLYYYCSKMPKRYEIPDKTHKKKQESVVFVLAVETYF